MRVIVSNSGRLRADLPVFANAAGPIIIFSTQLMPQAVRKSLAPVAEIFLFDKPCVNLKAALQILRDDYNVRRVVCEGGGTLLKALLKDALLDELHATLCPRIFGGLRAPTLTGMANDFLPTSAQLELLEMQVREAECFTRWKIIR
jgi:riboflavin biosynthesis pyrimidine reductase